MFAFIPPGGNAQILKTMAVLPGFRGMGIGAGLMAHVLAAGRKKGADSAIAALMADNVHSGNIIAKYGGKKMREYTLYGLDV
jgi:GNAT superfamily N-acetyltransferase